MRLILTHEKADFDAVASQLGAKKLHPAATVLLPRFLNRNVQQFLNLYWDALPYVRAADWRRRLVDSVILVDTQTLINVRGLVKNPRVHVIDHHIGQEPKPNWTYDVEAVGATTTLLVEKLQSEGLVLSSEEATLLLLGIHEDTGSLTYDTTVARDVRAAAWLLDQGAQLQVARRFLNVPLSSAQQQLYGMLLRDAAWLRISDRPLVVAAAEAPPGFDDEISSVAHRLRETLTPDGLFVLVQLSDGVQLVARSAVDEVDAAYVARAFGGGGHNSAAAAMIVGARVTEVREQLIATLPEAVRPTTRVAAIMSYGVETVPSTTRIADVALQMQRLGHEGFPVVDTITNQVVGLVTRRAVDRAMSHEMSGQPVTSIMRPGTITVRPSDSIERVQELMAAEGWGQIPVLAEESDGESGLPIGIVTRTDLITELSRPLPDASESSLREKLARSLAPELWAMVLVVSEAADRMQMPVYFVGGLVRDLLLGRMPTDLDIVVEGDAIALVTELRARFGGIVHTHGRFGTAKWALTPDMYEDMVARAGEVRPDLIHLSGEPRQEAQLPPPSHIDFVTARKEFYRRPTALPDVAPGSIKLDLHRRDFTINTLAVRLDGPHLGQLLDFYGGRRDLQRGLIRVLHSLSFVDDPTRILRAVRLEQRLGFRIEPGTAELIASALPLLDRVTGDRIRTEIELALTEADPAIVLERLDEIGALEHIHPGLTWRRESASVFSRIPSYAADPTWGTIYAGSAVEFFYFAVWLAPFDPPLAENVARRLRVRKGTLEDLLALWELRAALAALPATATPGTIAATLRPFSPRTMLTARILETDSHIATWLDRYVSEWRHVRTAVTGDDLRRMGLPPGPTYGRLLDRLLSARLDGEVKTEADERELLRALIEAQPDSAA